MKRLFLVLIILLLSVAAALWFKENNGYVLFTAGPWTLQMSLFVFIGGLLAFWLTLNALWGLVQYLWGMPSEVRRWAGNRQRNKARERLVGGLLLLAEGRNAEAEKAVLQRAEIIELPVLSYLVAAIAAQRRGAWDARDHYLTLAEHGERRAQIALGVLQAQMQVQAQQWEPALAKLNWIRERAPNNRHALRLLAESALALQDWNRLAELLPDLRINHVLTDAELEDLEVRTADARLQAAAVQGYEQIEAVWRGLTREQKRLPTVVALYARNLIAVGQAEQAEQLLRSRLEKEWAPQLVSVYAELDVKPAKQVLAVTERWLKSHPEDPELLYAAGCQALRSEIWSSAKGYLEAAAARTDHPEVLRMLGDLYTRLGESDRARDAYRHALSQTLGEDVVQPLPPVTGQATPTPPTSAAESFV